MPPVTTALIVANVAMFLLSSVTGNMLAPSRCGRSARAQSTGWDSRRGSS